VRAVDGVDRDATPRRSVPWINAAGQPSRVPTADTTRRTPPIAVTTGAARVCESVDDGAGDEVDVLDVVPLEELQAVRNVTKVIAATCLMVQRYGGRHRRWCRLPGGALSFL
jgi:hypothetical protein